MVLDTVSVCSGRVMCPRCGLVRRQKQQQEATKKDNREMRQREATVTGNRERQQREATETGSRQRNTGRQQRVATQEMDANSGVLY